VLGTVANLSRDKDPVTLLRGFAEIRKTLPGARLVIAGDGPEAGAARAEAERLGVAPDVEFLGFRGDVPRVLAALDVFVLSTRTEGMGIAILEAMAAGVPVVASAVGGVPEVVEDGVTGRLFAAGEAAALRDAVVEILNDRALREGLVGRALVRVRERFSMDRMVEEYGRLYRGAA
jgi:glycosyltransferase involved in cell wall biosynthesis